MMESVNGKDYDPIYEMEKKQIMFETTNQDISIISYNIGN